MFILSGDRHVESIVSNVTYKIQEMKHFGSQFFRPTWIYLKFSQKIGNGPRIKIYIMRRGAFILGVEIFYYILTTGIDDKSNSK